MTKNSKFSKKEAALNYVVVFFLSLEHFANECYEAEALRILLREDHSKSIYEDWWKIRDAVLLIQNMSGNVSVALRNFFLSHSETLVLIERVKNKESIKKEVIEWITAKDSEIKQLRKDIRHGKQLSKAKLEKLEKHFKIAKVCASPISLQLLQYFIKDELVDPNNKERNGKPSEDHCHAQERRWHAD